MIKLAAISPKTMVAGEQQGANSPEENELKNLFSQLSHTMLEGKAPNAIPYVTSFKVLEVDMNANRAVGAFELNVNGSTALIPVIMADGKVKSPEVIYSGTAKSFIPLTDKWLEEIQKPDIGYLGKSEKAPDTLSSDMDVRAATLPPTTGRFVYASARTLPDIIDACHPNTKIAFAKVLKSNPTILKMAMKLHGSDLLQSLKVMPKQEKIAKKQPVWVLGPDSGKEKFAEAFGSAAPQAYQLARHTGFVTRDLRTNVKIAIDETSSLNLVPGSSTGLTEPKFPGVYHVVGANNKPHKVIIIPRPFKSTSLEHGRKERFYSGVKDCYLVITPSNKHVVVHDKLLAIPDVDTLPSEGAFFRSVTSAKEPANGHNLFIGLTGQGVASAVVLDEPLTQVTKSGDGYTAQSGFLRVVITSSKGVSIPKVIDDTIYIPMSYRPIKSGKASSLQNLMTDVGQLTDAISYNLSDIAEGESLKVSHTIGGYWAVNGKQASDILDAMMKVAQCGVHLDSVTKSMSSMERGETKSFHLIKPTKLSKIASIFGPEPQMPAPPPPMPGGDPNAMMGPPMPSGDPNAMMGPPPPQQMPMETVNTMEAAAQTGDPALFNSAAIGSLVQSNPLNEAIAQEIPNVEKAMDSVAKILVNLQLREADLSRQMGQDDFFNLESNLRKVLGGLGDIVLSVHSQKRMSALPEGMM
jgi:hypothetical protein